MADATANPASLQHAIGGVIVLVTMKRTPAASLLETFREPVVEKRLKTGTIRNIKSNPGDFRHVRT
jgi:hypothetical protein